MSVLRATNSLLLQQQISAGAGFVTSVSTNGAQEKNLIKTLMSGDVSRTSGGGGDHGGGPGCGGRGNRDVQYN